MDSKDSFNKLGCHSSTFGTLHTVQGFKPKYTNHFCSLLFGQHKKKNKVQKRKATSKRNNAFHEAEDLWLIRSMEFQPQVWWKKTGDYPDPKVTNSFIQSQPPNKKTEKQNHFVDCVECLCCGLWLWSLNLKQKKERIFLVWLCHIKWHNKCHNLAPWWVVVNRWVSSYEPITIFY